MDYNKELRAVDTVLANIKHLRTEIKTTKTVSEHTFKTQSKIAFTNLNKQCEYLESVRKKTWQTILENKDVLEIETEEPMPSPISESTDSQMSITKELFIETIGEIEKQKIHDRKCSDAFKVLLPHDYTSGYDNLFLQEQLIKILKIATNDNHKDSWIEYFIWELDFGLLCEDGRVKVSGKDFKLETASDLWDLLNL